MCGLVVQCAVLSPEQDCWYLTEQIMENVFSSALLSSDTEMQYINNFKDCHHKICLAKKAFLLAFDITFFPKDWIKVLFCEQYCGPIKAYISQILPCSCEENTAL